MIGFEALRGLHHREAAGRLAVAGWGVCGVGDWAVVWRSPDGRVVARVCAFEPAYGVFVELCRRLEGHAVLPRIDFDAELAGGGRVTVMEHLAPAETEEREAVLARWDAAEPGDPVAAVRAAAEALDAEAAREVPFWGGLDRNPGNVMRRASGEPVLVDLFYANGLDIYKALVEDPAAVAAAFPAERREFICEIAVIARESSPEQIAALRAAAASIA
ncbi:hypothetical protein [Glycomyces paridis]|uniref:Aminoglycoside phosphotransferase domain-containing protein n=1 Tax=Glycomyces paridis TaxID=2126555 RepID=A0A4S8PER9_9ACTN|nr:hypothetical protein [Glycomyces paridis]THV28361.1 hypothetical protein E9998_12190 [Glycomyces paridis]